MLPASPLPAQQDLGAPIEDVSASTRGYIRANHAVLFGTVTTVCIAFAAVAGFFCYLILTSGLPDADLRITFVPLVPLMIPFMMYGYYRQRIQHAFVQQLAAELGFSYSPSAPAATVAGTFFSLGYAGTLSDVMAGTYKEKPVRIYTYQYTTGSGKSREVHTYTVFEMQSGVPLPHVLMNLPGLFSTPDDVEPVALEGGFAEKFRLHVAKGHQMEIREIFQPDVMEDMVNSLSSFSMEISAGTLYLMKEGTFTQRQRFLDMTAAVDTLLEDILPGLETVGRDEAAEVRDSDK